MSLVITTRGAMGFPPFTGHGAHTNLGIVVHYDGHNQKLTGKSHANCVDYWKGTRRSHMKERGWADIGYSYGACPHGDVLTGRGFNKEQAAQLSDGSGRPDGNERYVSVSLMSGPSEDPTYAQIEAVRGLRSLLMRQHGLSGNVYGHRDFTETTCPGHILYRLVRWNVFSVRGYVERPEIKLTVPYTRGVHVKEAQMLLGMARDEWDGIYGPITAKTAQRYNRRMGYPANTSVTAEAWWTLLRAVTR